MSAEQRYEVFETARGFVAIAWSAGGIIALRLPTGSPAAAERALAKRVAGAVLATPTRDVGAVIAAITRYFAGDQVDFSGVAVDLDERDPFFARVYALVRRLAWGQTTTYGTIAKELGAGPEAARDVGRAMAANPVPLIVPCHRVLAAGGKIGGFSAPGGSDTKMRMLELEGVVPEALRSADVARQVSFDFATDVPVLRRQSSFRSAS